MEADEVVLRELGRRSGLTRREVRSSIQLGVVTVSGPAVDPAMVRRLRRVRRLHRDLGLSLDTVAIIVRLLDRIEVLEQSISRTADEGQARR
jgi:hypothetical protein